MGCICSKGASSDHPAEVQREKDSNKSTKRLVAPSKREEVVVETAGVGNGGSDGTALLRAPQRENSNSTPPIPTDKGEKNPLVVQPPPKGHHQRRATLDISTGRGQPPMSRIISMSNGGAGEHAATGWPSWLTAVAGEAIKGWAPRRADTFEKLDKIGQGTYSNVYRARDLETGKIVAMKKVRFVNMDPESVRFMAREIYILRKLDHPNVMKLEGLVTSRMSCSLYLVFEYMEHDLAGLAATPGIKFTEAQIKCYMQQLLRGLEHCHNRGVLHRDIKGSNLLIDNNGNLKIGDYGLATFFNPDNKQPLTSRVVTLWYRPPELLLGATDYGVAVDLWSAGCILAELLAGKPIMPGRTEVEQLHKIFKLCGSPSDEFWRKSKLPHATVFKPQQPYKRCILETFKDFPPSALALLDVLLAIEPEGRGSAASALNSEFFTTKPLPCDPSSLPKYPPSKEFDAKLRDEEARKQKAAAKGRGHESTRRGSRESKAAPAPDANAELQASLQKRQGQSNPKSSSEKYNPQEDGGSGFPIEPPRRVAQNGFSDSGQLNLANGYGSSWSRVEGETIGAPGRAYGSSGKGAELRGQRSYMHQAAELSKFSGSVAVRGSHIDSQRERSTQAAWPEQKLNCRYNQLDDAEPSEKSEWGHHLLDKPTLSHRKGEKVSGRESTTGYAPKKNRIHYSGPLLPPGGNMEEMLKEHERQIQQAVRKARLDKAKTKKNYGDNGQSEALLRGTNGR
ncbi:probable serine/threonine-protein kinase At1g54610 isoform X1 [Telopea speciosissima]|uniref:probable serine/threonine-protein kinase At1g54610 isoform X1 n=1 Tax=Telopea speciosissima TaxID=54955 RepID=UPI001CC383AD|nr:probable serine/threonine-protein kinase At1g54610 isoform X1 [Telopea speciosissima]